MRSNKKVKVLSGLCPTYSTTMSVTADTTSVLGSDLLAKEDPFFQISPLPSFMAERGKPKTLARRRKVVAA